MSRRRKALHIFVTSSREVATSIKAQRDVVVLAATDCKARERLWDVRASSSTNPKSSSSCLLYLQDHSPARITARYLKSCMEIVDSAYDWLLAKVGKSLLKRMQEEESLRPSHQKN